MGARKVFQYKDRQGDILMEMVIWELPVPTGERLIEDFRSGCVHLAGWRWEK
jgi:hypothetical protein